MSVADREGASSPSTRPRATYRLQFGPDFGFADALEIVPYLASLGVSHVYASPLLAARPGSAHGYDIVAHDRLNRELGTPDDFEALVDRLHEHGMGLIMDFVPNHMGIGADNPWWADVLEWGPSSPYASYFDIDWRPIEPSLSRKVLLPVLADHYGVVLEQGELGLRLDRERGAFWITYGEARFPLAPRDYPELLRAAARRNPEAAPLLDPLAEAFRRALEAGRSRRERVARRRNIERLKEELARALAENEPVLHAVEGRIEEIAGTPGEPRSFDPLHAILERQFYRLAFWRVAAHEINYRRFFDISDLAGLRMDNPNLFEESHDLVRRLLSEGKIQGLRLDHVDGLRDPRSYVEKLRALAAEATGAGAPDPASEPEEAGAGDEAYLIVEKILASDEGLRPDWDVDGTTGYEFMATVTRLQVDPDGERGLTRAYERFIGTEADFAAVSVDAKHRIMRDSLGSELTVLANQVHRVAKQSRSTRDYTLTGLRYALSDVVAHFPVYRTYVSGEGPTDEDRRFIDRAVHRALRASRHPDRSIYDFIRDVLTLDLVRDGREGGHRSRDVLDAAQRFQQYTGPVMAKAIEDTAFYRYLRLVALNEVGGEPDDFALAVDVFHEGNERRLEERPYSMVATATHDHKRGEDVRARLAVLSEIPRQWGRRTRQWGRMNRGAKTEVEGRPAPGANDEYLLYQTLVGSWPCEDSGLSPLPSPHYRDRIDAYMQKAVREAKLRTSWAAPDEEYEGALSSFVREVLDPERSGPFLRDVRDFAARIAPAGAVNGLAQQLLKLTVPGVPDVYQGTELWDLSLVDPDNRAPVDYPRRRAGLDRRPSSPEEWEGILRGWPDGRVKQELVARLLHLRRARSTLFARGSYLPLRVVGTHGERVVAFAREHAGVLLAVVAPRTIWPLLSPDGTPSIRGWEDTAIVLPQGSAGTSARNVLTGREVQVGRQMRLPLEEALWPLPVGAFIANAPGG